MNLKQLNNKKGFTLLEIIIVVIIIGVLASLAMPRFFRTVEYSRSTEALNAIGVLRGSMERYFLSRGTYAGAVLGTATHNLDVEDPSSTAGNNPGAHFNYGLSNISATGYTLTATRNTLNGGASTSTVTLTVNNTTNSITRVGATAFTGIN